MNPEIPIIENESKETCKEKEKSNILSSSKDKLHDEELCIYKKDLFKKINEDLNEEDSLYLVWIIDKIEYQDIRTNFEDELEVFIEFIKQDDDKITVFKKYIEWENDINKILSIAEKFITPRSDLLEENKEKLVTLSTRMNPSEFKRVIDNILDLYPGKKIELKIDHEWKESWLLFEEIFKPLN